MKIIVYTDVHKNGPNPVKVNFEYGDNIFYIGDNHELKNITKKSVDIRTAEYIAFIKKCYETETNVLNGNHEVRVGTKYCRNQIIIKLINEKNVLFVHGDYPLWEEAKVTKWHTRKAGIGRWALLGIKIKNYLRNTSGSTKLSKFKIKLFSDIAMQHGCSIVVFGHTHPKRLIDETHNNIRIINCPRGRSVINI